MCPTQTARKEKEARAVYPDLLGLAQLQGLAIRGWADKGVSESMQKRRSHTDAQLFFPLLR